MSTNKPLSECTDDELTIEIANRQLAKYRASLEERTRVPVEVVREAWQETSGKLREALEEVRGLLIKTLTASGKAPAPEMLHEIDQLVEQAVGSANRRFEIWLSNRTQR